MKTLLELHDQMKDEYTKTAKFFGEDPNMTSTEEFFGVFSTFLDQFEVSYVIVLSKDFCFCSGLRKKGLEKVEKLVCKTLPKAATLPSLAADDMHTCLMLLLAQ